MTELALCTVVLVLLWLFLRREWQEHQAFRAAEAATRPPVEVTMPEEPAYRFPGIPQGWSLDRYARDGLAQINLHLAQHARRHQRRDPA